MLKPRRWLIFVFIALVLIAAFITLPQQIALSSTPVALIQQAWERARQAGQYSFTTDVSQTSRPLPTLSNVGRTSQTDEYHLEGTVDPAARQMEMTLWSQGGSVLDATTGTSIKIEGDKAHARQGAGQWQAIDNFSGLFAPDSDPLAFLAAAKNLQAVDDRYTFEIDGYAFATYVRDQLEARLSASGQLPPGMSLDLSQVYQQMTGRGEIRLTPDGYPRRLQLELRFPPDQDMQLEAQITSDFAGFAIGKAFATNSTAAFFKPIIAALPNVPPIAFSVTLTLGAIFLFWHFRYSRRMQAVISIALILSMILSPAVQSARAASLADQQRTANRAAEARNAESDLTRTLKQFSDEQSARIPAPEALKIMTADTGEDADRDGLTNAQEVLLGTSPLFRNSTNLGLTDRQAVQALGGVKAPLLQADTGVDADGDGLTDYQENLLGTNSSALDEDRDGVKDGLDSDIDGVTDYQEVNGFTFNGQPYYTDPLKADSNDDGLTDGQEWNIAGTGHVTWDLDGDLQPDILDRDDDGDGVPDNVDLSPFINTNKTFTNNAPLELQINNLVTNSVTYVNVQVRPVITAQLRYAYNVFDWPYDTQGQMQDLDGKTYYDLDHSLPTNPNANGDMKLVPMLEIRTSGATSNLPLRATPPTTTLTLHDQVVVGGNLGGQVTISQAGSDTIFQFADLASGSFNYRIYNSTCAALTAAGATLTPDGSGRASLSSPAFETLVDGQHAVVVMRGATLSDGYACANLPQLPREGNRWVDTELLNHYGINVLPQVSGFVLYAPLNVVTVDTTGDKAAFEARLIYRPEIAGWGHAQEVRLVWLVQALVDRCRNGNPYDCTALNNPEVLQTYTVDFNVTGVSVREDRGFETAVVYEDPAVDGDVNRDDTLLYFSHALEQTFLAAADCDTVVNDVCQGNGSPDFTLGEIQRRFDHATNASVPAADRWNLPNVLAVRTFTYAHADEALVDMVSVQNPAILASAFGTGATSAHPTLLTLSMQRNRSVNLDAAANATNTQATWTGQRLSFNLAGQALIAQAGVTWTPYEYSGGAWQAMRLADYWDELGPRYASDFSDEPDAAVAAGQLTYLRLYYLALAQGVNRVVQVNNVVQPVSFVNPKTPFMFKPFELGASATKFLISKALSLLEQGIPPANTFKYLGQLSLESAGAIPIVGSQIKTIFQSEATALNKVKRGAVIGAALVIGIGVGLSLVAYASASRYKTESNKIILQIGETAATAVAVGIALKDHLKIVKALGVMVWASNGSLEPLTKCLSSLADNVRWGAVGELIGLVVQIGVIWGTFVYAAISGQLQPDTIATSQFVANAIAQTILAILFFALSLTVVGSLLVGIINAIDAILGLLCNTFGVDSACFTLSGYAAQIISGNFFGVTPTVSLQMSDIGVVRQVELLPENAAQGFVEGAQVRVRATFYTRLLQDLSGSPNDMARQAYHASELFTPWQLQQATVRYGLNYSPTQAAAGQMLWQWTTNVYDTITAYVPREFSAGQDAITIDLYQGEAESTVTSDLITLHAARNFPLKGAVNIAYALPAAECWGERSLSTCKPRSLDGYVNPPIDAELLVLDVFPATLAGFYTFIHGSGFTQKDYDNDGLIAHTYGGLDPDDTNWDMDGDGVSDGVEMEQRSLGMGLLFDDPLTGRDSDNDDLTDAEELWRGTNPAAADTDRDGLTDREEIDGWLWAYSADRTLQTIVTADPTNPDTDGDGNDDKLERDLYQLDPIVYPFHPRHTDPVYMTLGVSISDPDGFLGGGQAFTYTVDVGNTTPVSHPLNFAGTVANALLNQGSDKIILTPLVSEFTNLTRGTAQQLQAQGQVRWTSSTNRTTGIATTATANFYEPGSTATLNWLNLADVTWSPDTNYNPLYAAIGAPNNWDDPFVVTALRTGLPYGTLSQYRVGTSATYLNSILTTHPTSTLSAVQPALVCANSESYCLMLWPEKTSADSPTTALRGQLLALNGQTYNDYFIVADDATCNATQPAAASDGHDFMLTWQCGDGVYARALDVTMLGGFYPQPTLGAATAPIDLTAPNAAAIDAQPSVAWTGNRYTIAWEKTTSPTDRDIYAAQVDVSANLIGSGVALLSAPDDTTAPQIAYVPASDAALIVYRAGQGVWSARLAGAQTGLSSATTSLISSSSDTTFNPRLAYDPRLGVGQIAWLTQASGTTTAHFRAISGDGLLYGPAGSYSYGGLAIKGDASSLTCSSFDCAFLTRADWQTAPGERNYYVHRYSLRATYPYLGAASLTRGVTFTVEFDRPVWESFSGLPISGTGFVKAGETYIIGGVVSDATSGISRVDAAFNHVPLTTAGQETWLASLTAPMIEGSYAVEITATDKADNARTTAFVLLSDATPPTLTTNLTDNAALQVAANADGRFIIPLHGTVADPQVSMYPPNNVDLKVEINVEPNGRGWQPATVNGTTWALDYALSALDASGAIIADPTGYYTVTLRATDQPGNVTAPLNYTTLHLYLDNAAPRVSLQTPDPGGVVDFGNVISITKGVTLITQTNTLNGLVTEAHVTESGVVSAALRLQPMDATMWPGLWNGAYRNSGEAAALFSRADEDTADGGLNFDWGSGAPDTRLNADNFSVEWQRLTTFSVGGTYTLTIVKDADSTAQLVLDDNTGFTVPAGSTSAAMPIHIEGGTHDLKLRYTDTGGVAQINFSAVLSQPDWFPVALSAAGLGVVSTTWQYPLPAYTEGMYAIEMRAGDAAGNVATEAVQPWQGEIDVAAPRVQLDVAYTGVGDTARTTYRVWAMDFNLSESGWASPCPIGLADRHYYSSAWWQQFAPGQDRLYQIYSECSVAGHVATLPVAQACDLYGHCAASNTAQTRWRMPNQKVLYTLEGNGQIVRLDLGTGLTSTVVTSGADRALTVHADGTLYYFDTLHQLWHVVPQSGASTAIYTDTDGGTGLAVYGTRLHWTVPTSGVRQVQDDGTGFAERSDTGLAGLDMNSFGRVYATGSTPGGLGKLTFFDGDDTSWLRTWTSTDPQISNGWRGTSVAFDAMQGQLYLAGQCGDPVGGPLGTARTVITGVQRLPAPTGRWDARTSVGCTPVIALSDPADVVLHVEVDQASQKLYYLVQDASTGSADLWRADLDGGSPEVIYTSTQSIHAFAVDDTNTLPMSYPTRAYTRADTPVSAQLWTIDVDGDLMTFSLLTPPTGGVLQGWPSGPSSQLTYVTYVPTSTFSGLDSFTYQADDGRGGRVTGVAEIDVRGIFKDSAILTPTANSAFALGQSVIITSALHADQGASQLQVLANGAIIPACTTSYSSPYPTSMLHTCTWTPTQPGRYDLAARVIDVDGPQTDLHLTPIYITHQPPAITTTTTVITAANAIYSNGRYALTFTGTATDSTSGHQVQAAFNGSAWNNAVSSGDVWTYTHYYYGSVLDGATYSLTAKVTDALNQSTISATQVLLDFAPPGEVTLTPGAVGVGTLVVNQTVRTTHDLTLDWTAATDGSGVSGYFAGWTTSATPPADGSGLTWYATPTQHVQTVGEAAVYYAHVGSRDTWGNLRWQTFGPTFVDNPGTPDLYNLDTSTYGTCYRDAYAGWLDTAGTQVGADYALYRRTPAYESVQRLYTTWDANGLALAWTGDDWTQGDNLFVYLDTAPGGATHAYNPWGSGPDVVLPSQGQPLGADDLIWLIDACTVRLYHWDGSTWQLTANANTSIDYPGFQVRTDWRVDRTIIRVPFAALNIVDPTNTALGMVAFATEPNTLKLWAAMPDQNPLNSTRANSGLAYRQTITTVTLTQQYHWPSLGSGVLPNANQFQDASVRVWLTPLPDSHSISYLDSGFFNLLTPGAFIDPDRDGTADPAFPFSTASAVGDGQVINYQVHYENLGPQTATGVNLRFTYGGALTGGPAALALGDLPGNSTGVVTITAAVNALLSPLSAELAAVIADDVHGDFDWAWVLHRVRSVPPTDVAITSLSTSANAGYIRSGGHTAAGTASDPYGVDQIELEITYPDASVSIIDCPQADGSLTTWQCNWTAPENQLGVISARARAHNAIGLWSGWSSAFTITVDDTLPPLSLTVDPALLGTFQTQAIATPLIDLYGTGTNNLISLQACLETAPSATCLRDNLAAAPISVTWGVSLTAPRADNAVITYNVSAQDAVWRTVDLSGTLRVDNVAPNVTTTCPFSQVALEDYWSGDPLLTPAPLALGIVSDGSGVITGSVRLSNSWDWNSYTPAEALNIVGGAWSYTPRFDTWGYHTLWVDLFDAAGNVAHTGCTVFVQLPTTDISLHAIASPETLVNTGAVTYTATITNSGALTATGTTLEIYNHALTGTLTTSDGVSCTALASALRCSIGSLGPNATRTITVAGLMPATSPEVRSFTALAYSAWQETNYANNWSFGAITVAHQADLQISQSGPTIVGSGQTVSYTLWITNAGPARVDASDGEQVSVADQLPIGLDFVAAAGEGWTCAYAGTVNCTRAGLDVGAAPPIVITLTRPLVTDSATARANTAYVAGSYDPVPGNNESSLALSVGDQAAVTVQMSSSATSLNLYDSITYLITATSAGPWPVMNATVIDALPAELMLLTYSAGCQPINATVECDLGNFQPGDTRHFTITAQYNAVNVYNTWLTNTATITAPYLYDLTTADNTATRSAWLYPSVDLRGTASVTPETAVVGRVVTYTAVIINDGPSAANFVTVTQALPPVVTYQSVAGDGWTCANVGNAVTCTRPALPAGQAATFTTTAQAVAWGWYESSRYDVASADFDRDMSDNPFFASLNVNSQYDLALTQTVSSEAVGLGDTLDYTLTAQNLGGLQVDGLTITNTLPAEVAFVSASGSWWMCSAAGQVVTCNYQITFHPGEASNVVVHTTLMSGSGLITNTATVGAPVEEDDLSNNTSVIAREINRPADLTVDLTADPAAIGLNFNLYATITNHGPETADRSTTITLTGSGDLIWYEAVAALDWSCTGAQTATGPIVCVRTAPLAVGASSTITVNLNTNADYTANAVVTSRWPEPTPTDNAATLPVPMQATINLELNGSVEASGLTSCPTCIEPGGVLTYTAWVGNYGNGDATHVNLISVLPAGTTFGGFISSAGFDTCTAASDVVTCTLSTLVSYNDVDPQVVFTATAPLAFGPFTTTVTANADQFDPWPESNHGDLANEVAYSGGWGEAFADEAGICGHYQPCYTTLNTAHNHTDWSSRLTIYPGTFTETLLTLSQNIEVVFLGDVLLNGSLDLTNGTFRAPSGSFTLTGNFTTTGGAFEANGGTLIFGGLNQQLSLFEPTTFNNLTVMTGTTLIEVGMANHANPIGLLSNYGTIRRTQPVTGSGPIEFGLAGNVNGAQLLIDVATQDTLTSITIDRFDRDHPLATRMTGRYWTITPTGSGVVTLTLPHTLTTPFNARVCGYETNWDCRADSYTANTVTRGNITSFSDWAVGDNVTPTALGLVSLTATSTDKVWLLWVGVLSGLLLAGAFRLRRRRTQG